MTNTVLVLGANGNFGSHAARAFAAAGWEVRRYQRGTDMIAAAKGVDVIVNGLNPPSYHNWKKFIPEITAQVIAAGLASGATVMVPGNVYVYGDQSGPWGPDTPHRPVSRKGAIRMEMERTYREASAKGLQTIILRGGDFLDPASKTSIMSMVVLKSLAKGVVTAPGVPTARRAYAYLPDMTRALVQLAEMRKTLPAFSDIPFAGYSFSVEDLRAKLQALSGRPLKMARFAWLPVRMLQPVWELAREMVEMRYLFDTPHSLDPAPLAALLPEFKVTPLDTIIAAHLPGEKQAAGSADVLRAA